MIHLIPLRNHQKLRHLYEYSFLFPYISITTLSPAAEAIICPWRQKYITVDAPVFTEFVPLPEESPSQLPVASFLFVPICRILLWMITNHQRSCYVISCSKTWQMNSYKRQELCLFNRIF
jgi:hypothetical protein